MFEFDQEIVDTLLVEDLNFKRLYNKHAELKRQVTQVTSGNGNMDDLSLETLKKQKLFLKDQMAGMIETYRRLHH